MVKVPVLLLLLLHKSDYYGYIMGYYGMCAGLHRVSLTMFLLCSAVVHSVACIQHQLHPTQTLTARFFLRRSQDKSSSMPVHTQTSVCLSAFPMLFVGLFRDSSSQSPSPKIILISNKSVTLYSVKKLTFLYSPNNMQIFLLLKKGQPVLLRYNKLS